MKDKKISFNLGSYSLFSTLKSVALIIAFFIMLKMYFGEKDLRVEQEELVEASISELKTWKNKDGENLAKIQVLETRNEKTFLAFKSQDSTIQELQKLVKQNRRLFKNNKGSAGIIKSETDINATTATKVTQGADEFPVYNSFLGDKWYKADIIAGKDSTNLKLKTFHNISLVMGSEYQGLFKKPKPYAIAKDDNIHSNIKDMRIYNVVTNKKHFVVGPYIGGGMNGLSNFEGQIGFGVTYKWFEF